eukprot:6290285-Amphidinium_carterae.1
MPHIEQDVHIGFKDPRTQALSFTELIAICEVMLSFVDPTNYPTSSKVTSGGHNSRAQRELCANGPLLGRNTQRKFEDLMPPTRLGRSVKRSL